ncbi:MAG: ATP-binding protein [Bacteroidales bacterium]|nr:ATP-binding protein [Bacteroidales bacterium]
MTDKNPFIITGYNGPELFCDRKRETETLISNTHNGVSTTLVSIRRMGKSGLIWHTIHQLAKKQDHICIYSDIYGTRNLKDFTNKLGSAILQALPAKKTLSTKFIDFLKGLRPVFSFDVLTGQPQLSFNFSTTQEYEQSIDSLLKFLDSQKKRVLLAIDEFQQISTYPEKNIEALLRSRIQTLNNVNMIFSGSSRHLLSEMFSNANRPFFASTQFLYLKEIELNTYQEFINRIFSERGFKITQDSLDYILDFSRAHTFYTQSVCNRLYAAGIKKITLDLARAACMRLLEEQEPVFFQFRNLLTAGQWTILQAIAREGKVYQPTSRCFMEKHGIGTPSNMQRGLESLLAKEMIYRENDGNGAYYSVYDVFLSRWLENQDYV